MGFERAVIYSDTYDRSSFPTSTHEKSRCGRNDNIHDATDYALTVPSIPKRGMMTESLDSSTDRTKASSSVGLAAKYISVCNPTDALPE